MRPGLRVRRVSRGPQGPRVIVVHKVIVVRLGYRAIKVFKGHPVSLELPE